MLVQDMSQRAPIDQSHVLTAFQHTINLPLKQLMASRDIRNIFADRYAGELLIKVTGEPPTVKNIAGKHGIEIGGFGVHSSGRRVIVNVTIDNLLKGAVSDYSSVKYDMQS